MRMCVESFSLSLCSFLSRPDDGRPPQSSLVCLNQRRASLPTKLTPTFLGLPTLQMNPYFTFSALLALGLRGIKNRTPLPGPPIRPPAPGTTSKITFERLPNSLEKAVEKFLRPESLAREVLGDEFVEHYGATRQHEAELYAQAVTDWELRRYLELA